MSPVTKKRVFLSYVAITITLSCSPLFLSLCMLSAALWLCLWFTFCFHKEAEFLDYVGYTLDFGYYSQKDLRSSGAIIASVLFSWMELFKRGAAGEAQMLFWSSGGRTAVRYAREGARETQRRQSEHKNAGSGCNPSGVITSYLLKAPCRSNPLWYPASFLFYSLLW